MAAGEQIRSHGHDDAQARPAPAHPGSPAVRKAWTTTLARLLPAAPARVLSVGVGDGFLPLVLARSGYRVTVLDAAQDSLAFLSEEAWRLELQVGVVYGDVADPPADGFDVVAVRHVLFGLPDPGAALSAWLGAAPAGRLVLLEDLWTGPGHPVEAARAVRREQLRRMREASPDHQGPETSDPPAVRATPERLAAMVTAAGWGSMQVHRLTDVEWARTQELPALERLYGVSPCFGIVADAPNGIDS